MISKELLNQINELMELTIRVGLETGRIIRFEYSSNIMSVYLTIFDSKNKEVIYQEPCYLDWKDGDRSPEVMFPIFKEKLEGLLKKEEVA